MSGESHAADAREQPATRSATQAKGPGVIGSPDCGCTSRTSTG